MTNQRESDMDDLNQRLDELRAAEYRRAAEWEEQQRRMHDVGYAMKQDFHQYMLPFLRSAKVDDYAAWLKGFMEGGGVPTHVYDYNMPNRFYVATRGFEMQPLYGALSVNVIVPAQIRVGVEKGLGHNGLFLMDGFECKSGIVPVYKDVRFS